jgi:hypothetical protein
MADYAPSKIGKLVVRYHAPQRRRVLWVVAVIVLTILVYGSYEWGRFDGGYSVFAMFQERRDRSAEMMALKEQVTTLRAKITGAETSRTVEHQSYADVERTLLDLQAQLQKQRDELAFYRGIVSPEDGVGGLRIQRVDAVHDAGEGRYKLRLVLMQSMRQDSMISGTVKIELVGERDKQATRLTLTDMSATRQTNEVPFSFRYFQNIEQEVALPAGFTPTSIDIEVKSSHQTPLQQNFPWAVRATE